MARFGSFFPQQKPRSRSWAWLFWTILLAAMFTGLHFRWGFTPPLARLLSPFEGAWQMVYQDFHSPGKYELKGRDGIIQIELDAHLVPHIEAVSIRDLFYAQGYILAKHRLWQLDFQTRASAGRLSEVVGEATLELDRFQRRFGLPEAAKLSLAVMMQDSLTSQVLLAYSEGINEAIQQLPARQLPLEFRVLDYQPEPWEPLNTALLQKKMAFTLAGKSDDRAMSLILEKFGKSVCDQLFPRFMVDEEPIISRRTPWNFEPLPIPEIPKDLGWTDTTDDGIPLNLQPKLEDDNGVGSNNWAVAGSKTASGFPILANDPHLEMKLPSTWYMMELKCPGYHAAGACLPGSPGIISGFNESMAWGITNGYPDVADWFRVTFKDNYKQQYWYDGGWKRTRPKKEIVKVRGKADVVDTVFWTEVGPVVYRRGEKPKDRWVPNAHALRWSGHIPGNELKAFLMLNQATSIEQAPEALRSYVAPAQNFVLADKSGHIAMYAQHGQVPLRWPEQGKFLLLAGSKEQQWQGFIPKNQLPTEINPARGFVSSANQNPVDSSYPYYLNWNYYNLERGRRINQLLSVNRKMDLNYMKQVQNDTRNLWAEKVLPEMLKSVALKADRPRWFTDALAKWNLRNDPGEIGPTLFETWFSQWMQLAWSDDFTQEMRYPDKHVTWQIYLEKDNSSWFDIRNTREAETGSQLLYQSLVQAADTLQRKLGRFSAQSPAYTWGRFKATRVDHLGRMKGLGTGTVVTGGGKGIVNATSTEVGQSWKLLVQLGPQPKALAIYPGGQSGNQASPFYNYFTELWRTGKYTELRMTR